MCIVLLTYDNRKVDTILLLLLLLTQGQGHRLKKYFDVLAKFCVEVFFCKHF